MNNYIFTIGHSNHSIKRFLLLLQLHQITAVADIRSQPYSGYNPQFNREMLNCSLKANHIEYVFLGKELGARSNDQACYLGNKIQYDRLANTSLFKNGLRRLLNGIKTHKIVLLCSEKEPLACHRTILVGRHLVAHDIEIRHILASGKIETHDEVMSRLLKQLKLPQEDLLKSRNELLMEAYKQQAEIIAYVSNSESKALLPQSTGTL
jgi:uncharacterized protein (DUF488 family)